MKVVILHPPLYPINNKFFNLLGKYVDLTVYSFGEVPGLHSWKVDNLKVDTYNLILIKGKTDLKKFAVSYKTQLNPRWISDIIKIKPDIVMSVAFWYPSLLASLLKKNFGYKFLISTDAICETEKNISFFRQNIRKIICKNTDMFISASDLTTEYLNSICENVGIKQSYQTIDIKEWKNELQKLPSKENLRKELLIPLDKTIMLGVGNFIEKKNWLKILEHMKFLKDYFFILIGSGKCKIKYEKYIKENRLENKVKIVGRKEGNELKKYFKSSDILVFPSLYDQFGYVVVEALASGLPVVCSKNCGASSLIVNGVNGFVIDPTSYFIDKIEKINNNLKFYTKNAFESVNTLTLENKVLEYLEIFQSVLKESK